MAADLKLIYQSATRADAEDQLLDFAENWDETYPMASQIWQRNWEQIVPFFAYPREIRKAIYTTKAIESLNMSLRKIIKMRGSFPTDEAALKLLYLALQNPSKKWTMDAYSANTGQPNRRENVSKPAEPGFTFDRPHPLNQLKTQRNI